MSLERDDRRRVVVVTGGGGGIGAAIAEELGRQGRHVVTVDPLVTIDGAEQLPPADETTAGRIIGAGGSACASNASVTDGDAMRTLFEELVDEHGAVDSVVNVAGITRPTTFAGGTEEDWAAVLDVHLGGYLNVLDGALPLMAKAGHGRILGVTSGSGWRPADTGAYGCAKRAVAALTWQLGARAPEGVTINAISPIAVTRMVTAALERAAAANRASGTSATGGLSLGSMPAPEQLGPIGAHLAGDGFSWSRGRVAFVNGSEVALVDEPRLIEVVRSAGASSAAHLLAELTTKAWLPAEAAQASGGGSNPRFDGAFTTTSANEARDISTCAIVSDRPELAAAVVAALDARGVAAHVVPVDGAHDFAGTAAVLAATVERAGSLDAVVVARAGRVPPMRSVDDWERILAEHRGLADDIRADAAWARAVADHAASTNHPVRLVTLTGATTAGGRSRAQAAVQLARASRPATKDLVATFAIGVETSDPRDAGPVAELTAHLLCAPEASGLAGAELVVGAGWYGLRSHPQPRGSIAYGGPEVPGWLDGALREIDGAPTDGGDR